MTSNAPLTISDIIERTTSFFQQKGIESARLDAQLLVAHALGKSRLDLYLNFDYPLNDDELARTRELVRRRGAREPVAYILGEKEFAGRMFKVGPGVLVPRPDTEILVEQVHALLTEFAPGGEGEPAVIQLLEFGVGSGAIAVSLAADNPNVWVTATEIDERAAETARQNAAVHTVADRVDVRLQSDFTGIEGPFHGIVSNPPYIDPAEKPDLEPEVAQYEPAQALFAENNGLRWYEFLAAQAARLLCPGGFLAVEIGFRQAESVSRIFAHHGLTDIEIAQDYADHDRVVYGRRR